MNLIGANYVLDLDDSIPILLTNKVAHRKTAVPTRRLSREFHHQNHVLIVEFDQDGIPIRFSHRALLRGAARLGELHKLLKM